MFLRTAEKIERHVGLGSIVVSERYDIIMSEVARSPWEASTPTRHVTHVNTYVPLREMKGLSYIGFARIGQVFNLPSI